MLQRGRLSLVLLSMILSLILLSGFMGYWLSKQYEEEKVLLKNKLEQNLAESQRQVVDSLLFQKILLPILGDSTGGTMANMEWENSVKDIVPAAKHMQDVEQAIHSSTPKKPHLQNIRLELNVNDSTFVSSTRSTKNKLRKTLTVTSDGSMGKKLVHRGGQQISIKKDTSNMLLMQGMRLILNEIAGSTNLKVNSSGFVNADTALLKAVFKQNLQKDKLDFATNWFPIKKKIGANSANMLLSTNMFANNYKIQVLDTRWFLIKKMQSRLWFVLTVLGTTIFAFVISYRGLAKQVRLNQVKSDLINNMSHELKTPIATVKVALEALQDQRVLNNENVVRDYLNMASLELNRLELLMNKVLNSSLLDHKQGFISKEKFVINDLVNDTLATLAMRAEKQGVSLVWENNLTAIEVFADKTHTQGVLLNLVDNAIKYAGTNPKVTVKLEKEGNAAVLKVADNGPGIPEVYLTKVFDKFFRVPNGDIHNTKGFGLGLSYAKQVMTQQGGEISVRNLPQGGCEFTLRFA